MRRLIVAAVAALVAIPVTVMSVHAASTLTDSTVYACRTSTGTLTKVRFDHAPACSVGQQPVQWQGQIGPVVGSTPTPSPTATVTPTPPPTPTITPSGWSCVAEKADGNVGCPDVPGGTGKNTNCAFEGASAYCYPRLPNSNGYTTYVNKDCWGNPGCQYKLESNNPGDWQVTANEPAGNTSVRTYPDAQQLTNNWCPNRGFVNCDTASTDMPIAELASLTSTYAEAFPDDVTAQFAWDMWATNNTASQINEIMVWVDNHNRGSGGAEQVGTATVGGQDWTIYQFGSTELIWSLGAPGTFAKQASGSVDLLAILKASIDKGFLSAGTKIAQVNAGWEICSTGGVDKTFRVTDYSVSAVPA